MMIFAPASATICPPGAHAPGGLAQTDHFADPQHQKPTPCRSATSKTHALQIRHGPPAAERGQPPGLPPGAQMVALAMTLLDRLTAPPNLNETAPRACETAGPATSSTHRSGRPNIARATASPTSPRRAHGPG